MKIATGFHHKDDHELVAGTLRAYRCWNVNYSQMRPREVVLQAVTQSTYWDQEMTAQCLLDINKLHHHPHYHHHTIGVTDGSVRWPCYGRGCPEAQYEVTHQAPVRDCSCGIYGWYTPEWTQREHTGGVMGVIETSGRLVLGSRGCRAEKAKIVAIAPVDTLSATVMDIMNVWLKRRYPDVVIYEKMSKLLRNFPPELDTLSNLGIEVEGTQAAPSKISKISNVSAIWQAMQDGVKRFI